jgi:hypothetical protein
MEKRRKMLVFQHFFAYVRRKEKVKRAHTFALSANS